MKSVASVHIKTFFGARAVYRIAPGGIAAALLIAAACVAAGQTLAVQPVTLQLSPGQRAATLTVTNRGTSETAIQVRVFAWSQDTGKDELTPSDEVSVSPPIATIAAGDKQLIRLILRGSPQEREVTYRVLLDQIPPPAISGVVRVVLRLSIPIFALPMHAVAPHVQFHMESEAGKMWLVGVNAGQHHERLRDLTLSTKDGATLKTDAASSPYVLPGATRRWAVDPEVNARMPGEEFHLTAHGEGEPIVQQVQLAPLP